MAKTSQDFLVDNNKPTMKKPVKIDFFPISLNKPTVWLYHLHLGENTSKISIPFF